MSDYEVNQIIEKAESIIKRLKDKNMTIALSESVTGGGFSYYLSSVPGSSEVFLGGIIAYTIPVKTSFAGVSQATIDQKGVVSAEVAIEMASGVRERFGASIGMGVTGYAGPGGGDKFARIGDVFWGIVTPTTERFLDLNLFGDRYRIRLSAILEGMGFLYDALS